jgi:hypothetical protein
MNPEELLQQWQNKSQETVMVMQAWRQAHPKATLAEIEQAVDEQITQLRASMIEEVAQAHDIRNEIQASHRLFEER